MACGKTALFQPQRKRATGGSQRCQRQLTGLPDGHRPQGERKSSTDGLAHDPERPQSGHVRKAWRGPAQKRHPAKGPRLHLCPGTSRGCTRLPRPVSSGACARADCTISAASARMDPGARDRGHGCRPGRRTWPARRRRPEASSPPMSARALAFAGGRKAAATDGQAWGADPSRVRQARPRTRSAPHGRPRSGTACTATRRVARCISADGGVGAISPARSQNRRCQDADEGPSHPLRLPWPDHGSTVISTSCQMLREKVVSVRKEMSASNG